MTGDPVTPDEVWRVDQPPGASHKVLLCNGVPKAQGDIATLKLNPGYWKCENLK